MRTVWKAQADNECSVTEDVGGGWRGRVTRVTTEFRAPAGGGTVCEGGSGVHGTLFRPAMDEGCQCVGWKRCVLSWSGREPLIDLMRRQRRMRLRQRRREMAAPWQAAIRRATCPVKERKGG